MFAVAVEVGSIGCAEADYFPFFRSILSAIAGWRGRGADDVVHRVPVPPKEVCQLVL